ncbi:hypothetical protein [Diplocloster modestus]|uniref:Type 4 fimbrial biogenesis protein PilX N-terminal domain-containing protein n=1 Tax=Diplocloster modestus TaxID=2850322 RepID=A0ABS6K5F8_9FIRM|nr:hypothetical protein [Diplocloster modestus]MBU9725765.1 hypothetical protein [Diplocloster modestus]
MLRKRGAGGIGLGAVSILAVFVVLCMTVFSILSFTSARADQKLSEKNAQAVQEYYQAESEAEEQLGILLGEKNIEDFLKAAVQEGCEISNEGQNHIVNYVIKVNEIQDLYVEIALTGDNQDSPQGRWSKQKWEIHVTEPEQADETLNVLKKE